MLLWRAEIIRHHELRHGLAAIGDGDVIFVRDSDVEGECGKSEDEEEEGVFHGKGGNDETRMRNAESMTKHEAPSFRHSNFIHHSPFWFRHLRRRFKQGSF
jgi:hypothetical protein